MEEKHMVLKLNSYDDTYIASLMAKKALSNITSKESGLTEFEEKKAQRELERLFEEFDA